MLYNGPNNNGDYDESPASLCSHAAVMHHRQRQRCTLLNTDAPNLEPTFLCRAGRLVLKLPYADAHVRYVVCPEGKRHPLITGFDKLALVVEEQITEKIRRRVISGGLIRSPRATADRAKGL